MTVCLRSSSDLNPPPAFDCWAAVLSEPPGLPHDRVVQGLGGLLEEAFSAIVSDWWALGREMASARDGELGQAVTCSPNASDMGLMMAWTHLTRIWGEASGCRVLVVCDDPWLYRALAELPNVESGKAPTLWFLKIRLRCRGLLSRSRVAVRALWLSIRFRFQRRAQLKGGAHLLVYGHPASTVEGMDGYFGDLMRRDGAIKRMMHVDCSGRKAAALARDGRTFSLHGWGSPPFAIRLSCTRWRAHCLTDPGKWRWLVLRSQAYEGATGQAAEIAWQNHCQSRWLRTVKPEVVAWPWENHAWERPLVREARRHGVSTVGYQHTVVGKLMVHYSVHCTPDGSESLPDVVLSVGKAYAEQLRRWGIPEKRLKIAGALRFQAQGKTKYDPNAPVFLAVPFDHATASEMIAVAKRFAGISGRSVLVKDHPLFPITFAETARVRKTDKRLEEQEGVSCVVYAATTVGLEAILMGLPTLRFQPSGRLAIDVLPDGIEVPVVDSASFSIKIETVSRLMSPVAREDIFAVPDFGMWTTLLHPQLH